MNNFVNWWGKSVFCFLCLSIALLGVGSIELPFGGIRFSAWSTSRAVFFFWLAWKFLVWVRDGQSALLPNKQFMPLPLLFFFAIVTASLLPGFQDLKDYRYFLLALFHYVMVVDVFSRGERSKLLLALLGIVPGFLVVRGILADPGVLDLRQMSRLGDPYYPSRAGYLFSMAAPLALAVTLDPSKWSRSMGLLSYGVQVLGLLLTYSRGAWMGWMASMLFLAFAARQFKKLLFILALFTMILLAIPTLSDRLATLVNPYEDLSTSVRIRIMETAFALALERPLLGIGYGRDHLKEELRTNYGITADQNFPMRHPHNLYINLFVSAGLLGLGAFLWLLAENLYRLLSETRRQTEERTRMVYFCIAAAFIAFMVTGLGEVPLYHHETRIFFFTLLALTQLYLPRRSGIPAGRS